MVPLIVTITPLYVVAPALAVDASGVDLTIEQQEVLAPVVETPDTVSVALQGAESFVPIVIDGDEATVTISSEGPYTANVIEGESVVAVFSGISFAEGISDSFETVNRNLRSYSYVINYDLTGRIQSIFYDLGLGLSITKQFGYVLGLLTTITLSGDVPNGVSLVKTLSYTTGKLTGVSYS